MLPGSTIIKTDIFLISTRPFSLTGQHHRHALRALRVYVNGVKSIVGIVNRKAGGALIAFRGHRALAVPTALIAWFGGEEWRCGFPGGANVVSERPRNAPMTWAHLGG